LDAFVDQGLDLARGLGAALGQAPHLGRHHRKAAALFTGARGFHRGVQRQDVGLEGDAVDDTDDLGDLAAAGADGVHRRYHLAHHLPALGWPPPRAPSARRLACWAEAALCRSWSLICCMLAEVCSRLAACCSVRLDRSALPLAISWLALLTCVTATPSSRTVPGQRDLHLRQVRHQAAPVARGQRHVACQVARSHGPHVLVHELGLAAQRAAQRTAG
jgi:hypothetical protein